MKLTIETANGKPYLRLEMTLSEAAASSSALGKIALRDLPKRERGFLNPPALAEHIASHINFVRSQGRDI
jgi:hypothetical protein